MRVLVATLALAALGLLFLACGDSQESDSIEAAPSSAAPPATSAAQPATSAVRICLEGQGFLVTADPDAEAPNLLVTTPSETSTGDSPEGSDLTVTSDDETTGVSFSGDASMALVFFSSSEEAAEFADLPEIPGITPIQAIGSVLVYWRIAAPEAEQQAIAGCIAA